MTPTHTIGRTLAAERPPMQPGLLGIEDAPTVPELRYSLVGQLRRMPEVRVTPDGIHAHLIVECAQPPHGGHSRLPFTAVYHAAAGAQQVLELHQLSQQMTAGALVLVICRGIDFDSARHELRAWRCDRITAIPPAEAARFIPDQQVDNHEVHHA